jgi:acetate kinase
MNIVLNAGFSSLKYQLVDPATGQRTLAGAHEELGKGRSHPRPSTTRRR